MHGIIVQVEKICLWSPKRSKRIAFLNMSRKVRARHRDQLCLWVDMAFVFLCSKEFGENRTCLPGCMVSFEFVR